VFHGPYMGNMEVKIWKVPFYNVEQAKLQVKNVIHLLYIQTRKYRPGPACGPIYFMGLDIRIVRQTHPSF
jgi:hypothetical protein